MNYKRLTSQMSMAMRKPRWAWPSITSLLVTQHPYLGGALVAERVVAQAAGHGDLAESRAGSPTRSRTFPLPPMAASEPLFGPAATRPPMGS